MRRWNRLAVPLALLLAIGACTQQPDTSADDAFAAFQEAYAALETPEEKSQAIGDFLRSYPSHERSADFLGAYAYFQGEKLDDTQAVYELATATLGQVTDPELKFDVGIETAKAAHTVGADFDLSAIITPLAETRDLTFGEHLDIMRTSIDTETWNLVVQHADQASPLATAEQFRTDYPDRDYTDEEIVERGNNRQALVRTYRGWGLYNQDQVEDGTADLEAACEMTGRTYVGVPENDSCRYLAEIALAGEDTDRAIELALPYATMGGDEDALAMVTKAHSIKTGSDEGLEEFLWTSRIAQAKTVDGFSATDYAGETFELDSLQDKVVLLAFWFPT